MNNLNNVSSRGYQAMEGIKDFMVSRFSAINLRSGSEILSNKMLWVVAVIAGTVYVAWTNRKAIHYQAQLLSRKIVSYIWGNPKVNVSANASDCDYLFHSSVFKRYYDQLKTVVNQQLRDCPITFPAPQEGVAPAVVSFEDNMSAFLNSITTPEPTTIEGKRSFHETMLRHFRAAITSQPSAPANDQQRAMVQMLDKVAIWMYAEVQFMDSMIEFVEDHGGVLDTRQPLSQLIQKVYTALCKVPFNAIVEPVNGRLYDPHKLGDLPSHLYTIRSTGPGVMAGPSETRVIRTPAVTRDLKRGGGAHGKDLSKAQIVEEFTQFLKAYKKQNKQHLYVNLMERRGSSERIRSKLIEGLETNPEYQGSICVVTLSKNCHFYTQTHEHAAVSDATTFKQTFHQELFKSSGNFYWPSFITSDASKMDAWQAECTQIIQQVHADHYGSSATLTVAERKDFIEHVYARIVESLINKSNPTSVNIACKSCIDRGAQVNGLMLQRFGAANRVVSSDDSRIKKMIAAVMLAPAILTQGRNIQPDRFPRTQTVFAAMGV